jgi:dihydrofolate synthase/folylpolyglutamate synthase
MTYEESIQYIENACVFGIQPGLGRIEELLRRLGEPQRDYKTIHVTGTNGKGSVTAMITQVLDQAGIATGRFTSPHLEEYTERISTCGRDISKAGFAVVISQVAAAVTAMMADGFEQPTEFELLTAAAFLYFSEQHVEYAVIEVGLGGLLDSTNVIVPVLSVITNVALDHMKYCGNTVEEIAVHKAGILKQGIPAVTAAIEPALAVIKQRAAELSCPLAVGGEDFTLAGRCLLGTPGQQFTVRRKGHPDLTVTIPLLGRHQAANGAVAVMALTCLAEREQRLTDDLICHGLARVSWPGRFQVLQVSGVDVVIDGAHNPAGIHTFCQTYGEVFGQRQRVFLFSVLADKDYTHMVQELFRPDDYVICAPAPSPRTSDPKEMAAILPCRAAWADSIAAGLDKAFAAVTDGQVLCIAGSLYIQGDVRRYLREKVASGQ